MSDTLLEEHDITETLCDAQHPTVPVRCVNKPGHDPRLHNGHNPNMYAWKDDDTERDTLSLGNIGRIAEGVNSRPGPILWNLLPGWASGLVARSDFDPFYGNMSYSDLNIWIADHLVFSDQTGKLLCIKERDRVVAARPTSL